MHPQSHRILCLYVKHKNCQSMAFAPPPLICGFHLGKSMCSNTNTESRFLVDSSADQTKKKKRKKEERIELNKQMSNVSHTHNTIGMKTRHADIPKNCGACSRLNMLHLPGTHSSTLSINLANINLNRMPFLMLPARCPHPGAHRIGYPELCFQG